MKASPVTIFCILLALAFIGIPEVSAYSYNSYAPYASSASYNSYYSYNTAYPYTYNPDLYPVYSIYGSDDSDKYDNVPVVAGPFPRGYLAGQNFRFDDYHHYDEFIGYSDLDVFNPQTGVVEVIRNPDSKPLDLSQLPENVTLATPSHVYGYIPGPNGTFLMYRKHYGHEHPWDEDYYGYYNYYVPSIAYRNTPIITHPCQQRSICEKTHSCC